MCGATLPFLLPVLLACPLVMTEPHMDGTNLTMNLTGANTNTLYVWQSSTNLTDWQDCCPIFQGEDAQSFAFPVQQNTATEFFRCRVVGMMR